MTWRSQWFNGNYKGEKIMRKYIVLLGLILILLIFFYFSGYRFTPKQAADANAFLEDGAQIMSEVDIGWGHAYIYNTSESYLTVFALKSGFLWRSPVSTYVKHDQIQDDPVKTIGWMSFTNNKNKKATILVIENEDEKVALIEAGKEFEREKKSVKKGDIVTFVWDEALYLHNIKPVAFSITDEELYRYGYPLGTTCFRDEDVKWHSIN